MVKAGVYPVTRKVEAIVDRADAKPSLIGCHVLVGNKGQQRRPR